MTTAVSIGLVLVGVGLWLGRRRLDAVVRRVGDRTATWLLPDERPTTYGLAWVAARIAGYIAPDEEVELFGQDELSEERHLLVVGPLDWTDPEAVLAELEADRAEDRITSPLRLVMPVLFQALRYRGAYVVGVVLALPALLLVAPMFVFRHVRWSVKHRRRTRLLSRTSTYRGGVRVYVYRERAIQRHPYADRLPTVST